MLRIAPSHERPRRWNWQGRVCLGFAALQAKHSALGDHQRSVSGEGGDVEWFDYVHLGRLASRGTTADLRRWNARRDFERLQRLVGDAVKGGASAGNQLRRGAGCGCWLRSRNAPRAPCRRWSGTGNSTGASARCRPLLPLRLGTASGTRCRRKHQERAQEARAARVGYCGGGRVSIHDCINARPSGSVTSVPMGGI